MLSVFLRFACLAVCSVTLIQASSRPASVILPVWFEPSKTGEVFHSRGTEGGLSIDSRGAWMQVRGAEMDSLLRLRLLDSSATLLEGEAPLSGRSFRLLGNDPKAWRKDIPHFQRIRARNAYPGIDVVYYSTGRQLEYDFVLAPGADPAKIAIRMDGGSAPVLTQDGGLRVIAGGTEVLQHRPVAYQTGQDGRRSPVEVNYSVADNGQIRFLVGSYDRSRELVIDPVLSYSGYFGGTTIELVSGVAAAPDGSFWIVGTASSELTPPEGTDPYQSALRGNTDAFIANIAANPDNTWAVRHFSYLGGDDNEEGLAIAVDANGVVYFTGWTISFNFPMGGNAFATTKVTDGDRDVFVAKYDPRNGGAFNLAYSTYYGSAGREQGLSIAVDKLGRIVVGGATLSGTLPEAAGKGFLQPSNRGGTDGFVAVFDPNAATAAATLVMSTFFGGNGADTVDSIAISSDNRIVIGGYTSSSDLPIAGNVYQATRNGGSDGYFAFLDPNKTQFEQLVYAGYFGGSGIDRITSIGVDSEDKLWLAGYTQSESFPTTPNAWSTVGLGSTDAFLARVDPGKTDSSFLIYSTLYGGTRTDVAYGLKVISPSRAVITGYSSSRDVPYFGITGDPGQPPGSLTEMFAASFDISKPATGSLEWSLLFGGAKTDVSTGVAVNAQGDVFVVGYTDSYGLNGLGENVPGKMNGVGQPSGFFFCIRPDVQ